VGADLLIALGDRSPPGAGISAARTRSDVRHNYCPGTLRSCGPAVRFLGKLDPIGADRQSHMPVD